MYDGLGYYSEGNRYTPLQEWTLYVRETQDDPWSVLRVTEQKDEVDLYVIDLNQKHGWQKYAVIQRTETLG